MLILCEWSENLMIFNLYIILSADFKGNSLSAIQVTYESLFYMETYRIFIFNAKKAS